MSKVTISRIFETSRALATKSGQELSDVVDFLAELGEQTLRNLRGGLTYTDNFDCSQKTVGLRDDVATVVAEAGSKVVTEVRVRRFRDPRYSLDTWLWYLDQRGRLIVKATFTPAPAATYEVPLDLLVTFG